MKILIVGAGAVGQVYGRHLASTGAEVCYLVKENHATECRRGFNFYLLNRRNARKHPVRQSIEASQILTSPAEVGRQKWDQVYFCMSSAGLRGEWLQELAPKLGDATVVALLPGPDDRSYLLKYFPESQLVSGMITIIGYGAPLPGESVPEPGIAYWLPPFSPAPYSGPEDRVRGVVDALRRGGMPSKIEKNVPARVAFPAAVLMTLLTALESVNWSFSVLVQGDHLRLAREATLEAMEITHHTLGIRGPKLLTAILRPSVIRLMLFLARFEFIVPLDLKTYFRIHFTKVGDQTRLAMRTYLEQGRAAQLPVKALEALESRIR